MKYYIVSLLFFINCYVFSQKIQVLDKKTGKTIKNITVYNQNKTISLSTDGNGYVNISDINNSEIILFSHISYANFRIKKSRLKDQNNLVYLTKHSEQLDEIVISSFKKAEKTKRIAEQIDLVNQKEIEQISPQTSADLLATIPGIKVQKSQFGGGSPVLRGMESNRVLLVVDGVRMNNAIYRKGHLQNAITVSPNLLDKVEVIFGPSSVIYGSDALGGVVHYYTKTPKISAKREIKSQFLTRYSSANNEITTLVSSELRFENWASFTGISHSNFGDLRAGKNRRHGFKDWGKVFFYSENDLKRYKENPTPNSNTSLQRNTGYNQTDILQKFYIPLSKNTDLKFNFQYSTSSNIPRFDRLTELNDISDVSSLKFAEWFYGPQNRFLAAVQLIINPNKKWIESGTITTAYQNIQESRIQRKFGSLARTIREETVDIFSINGDFSVPIAQKNQRFLSYGFELNYNDVQSNSFGKTLNIANGTIDGFSNHFKIQSRYPDGGSNYTSAAIYSGYRQDLNKKSTLNTGIRLTSTHLEAKWIDERFLTLEDNNIMLDNTAVTANIGYVFRPNKAWQINSVLSSGFRSPNIDDIGRIREKSGNVTLPNIYLQPEFAYNAELGIQKFFNDSKFRLGTNLYYTLLDNYIQRDFVRNENGSIQQVLYDGEFGNATQHQNKKTAYIAGFTINYLGQLSNSWNTSGSVTYTEGRTYDTNEPMSSIPPVFGNFQMNYQKEQLNLGATVRFNGRKDISDFNLTEGIDNHDLTPVVNATAINELDIYYGSPSWITFGLHGSYQLNTNVTLQARLDNLFDEHYIEFASGVAAAGRNLSISFLGTF